MGTTNGRTEERERSERRRERRRKQEGDDEPAHETVERVNTAAAGRPMAA